MAFRGGKRKDVKKQSYYVWFLGAKESKGLRGEEYIRPVLRHLVDKERELEPMKVTLQVSTKGIKIIQNVPRKNNKGKTEQIKHFIPHHAITCVMQESKPNDDVVCCILLIYNPLTKCPVHVHAYRCDSVETASTLRSQLQILIDRPENQKKFREIENRLAAKGLLPTRCLNSDGRSTRTDGSDRTEDSSGGSSEREVGVRKEHIASLYDSLAAELRERLNNRNSCPILLPPKDYDTVSRRQGRLDGIDNRRSTNYSLVGLTKTVTPSPLIHQNGKSPSKNQDSTSAKSSGGKSSNKSSSGIGSDEALSSAIQEVSSHPDFGSKEIDPDTSSDDEEDWPDTSGLNDEDDDDEDEDEVVPSYEWRRPPRFAPVAPAAVPPQPRDRRSRSSPDEEDIDPIFGRVHRGVRGIVDKFERRAVSPTPVSQEPPSHHNRTPVKMAANPRRSDPYADHSYRGEEPDPQDHLKQQHFEVVYRRHSNPLEKKIQRESRPVSYPAAVIDPVSPRLGKSRPGVEPHMDHRTKYKELPRQNFAERESRSPQQDIMVDHHNPVQRYPGNYDRYSPSHPRDRDLERPRIGELEFYRDSRPMSSSPVRQFRSPDRQSSPHNMYPRQRQASATDIRQAERAFPSRFVEPYPSSRPTYHPPPNEERRRSGYFDLPVDPRDYRHSFVESPFRRLPLNTQY